MAFKVYLAGPDVFLRNAHDVGRDKMALCRKYGFEGLFPLDQELEINGTAAAIFRANRELMRQADAGLFNLTPFRGPSADAGTIFELGFMFAGGKPVYGYTSVPAPYAERVDALYGPLIEEAGDLRDVDGYGVEGFGLNDNLMIVRAIEEAGGIISVVEPEDSHEPLAAFKAFEACLIALSKRFGVTETEAGKVGESAVRAR